MNINNQKIVEASNLVLKKWVANNRETLDEVSSQDGASGDDLVCEMATIGWPIIDGVEYKLSIHGLNTRDRPTPHIHLDRADDLEREKFKFEISLIDLLATGEPVLVLQKDMDRHIDRTNKSKCNWNGYKKLHDGVLAYLEAEPEDDAPKNSRSNLESFIIHWNKESGSNPNRLAEYIKEHGVKVLGKYQKYFPSLYPPAQPRKPVLKNHHSRKYRR